ncbi:phosphohistidine phosphatase SixA [Paraglaciecola mesophila]|nr:phosphohistidine phosphatase SixA [Paraglaciecola mesophila]|tara:strand:- start:955 stop:1428 length:474 start_codon:yes stop_codon:yes gene_type:complete
MHIIIMRHGEAEAAQYDDSSRELTSFGREQARAAGQWLLERCEPSGIEMSLVSPFIRARQTLEAVGEELTVHSQTVSNDITPDGNIWLTHDYIDYLLEENRVKHSLLIVSHMPFVSYFLDEVTGQQHSLFFDTSSIVMVDYQPTTHSGTVLDIYHPS